MKDEKPWVCIIRTTNDSCYLLMTVKEDKKMGVTAFESQVEGIRSFEKTYYEYRERGGTWVGSISLNALCYQPSIVSLTLEEAKALFSESVVMHVRNVAGSFYGVPLKPEAKAIWEAGEKPMAI